MWLSKVSFSKVYILKVNKVEKEKIMNNIEKKIKFLEKDFKKLKTLEEEQNGRKEKTNTNKCD